MKSINVLVVSLAFVCALPNVLGQDAAKQPPLSISDLIQQGHLALAISVLKSELQTPNLPDLQRARSCALLGYAYKEEGKLDLAQHYFAQALRLMDAVGHHTSDYAATLDFYAGTLASTGDFEAAASALHKASLVDAKSANHAALALVYAHTAELDIERKKFKLAKKELDSARVETSLVQGRGPNAEIDSASGWLAVATAKFHEGVIAYSASLYESRSQFGENGPVTGWSYILLGNAQDLDHNQSVAESNFVRGLAILKETVGPNNIQYLLGELAYSEMLDRTGSNTEAARIRSSAEQSIRSQGLLQCAGCIVSVGALRYQAKR